MNIHCRFKCSVIVKNKKVSATYFQFLPAVTMINSRSNVFTREACKNEILRNHQGLLNQNLGKCDPEI